MLPQTYSFYYPSGTQMKVFFGNIWIDDIVTLGFDLAEGKVPFYGYASKYFDAVGSGTIIVQGSFSIAFKKPEYISQTIEALRASPFISGDVLRALGNKRAAQLGQERAKALEGSGSRSYEEVLDLARVDDFGNFQGLAEGLKRSIWKTGRDVGYSPTDHDRTPEGTIQSGFDIIINYGKDAQKVIQDCHITGVHQAGQASGEPILEVYSFFARCMDPQLVQKTEGQPSEVTAGARAEKNADVKANITLYPARSIPDGQWGVESADAGAIDISVPPALYEDGWRLSEAPDGMILREDDGANTTMDNLQVPGPIGQRWIVSCDIEAGKTATIYVSYKLQRYGVDTVTRRTDSYTLPIR